MTRKQVQTRQSKSKQPNGPSTGQGADSALEAMIKRRGAEPAPGHPLPAPTPKKS